MYTYNFPDTESIALHVQPMSDYYNTFPKSSSLKCLQGTSKLPICFLELANAKCLLNLVS